MSILVSIFGNRLVLRNRKNIPDAEPGIKEQALMFRNNFVFEETPNTTSFYLLYMLPERIYSPYTALFLLKGIPIRVKRK